MSKKFWNFSNSGNKRVLQLYGVIAEESWFDDEVTPEEFAVDLQKTDGDLELWINSPGGDCIAAAQIYNMLKEYKGKVTVKIDGIAASAASVVAMAGDSVLISPVGMLMIHNPSTLAIGDENEMQAAIEMLSEIKKSIINAYSLKTGKSDEEISELMDNETWMSAKTALSLGFVDGIIDVEEDDDDSSKEDDKSKSEQVTNKTKQPTNEMLYSVRQFNNNLSNKVKNVRDEEKTSSPRKRFELIKNLIG